MTTTDFSARLTEAFRPVASKLPPALASTLADLHAAAGAQDLAGTLKHGARLAGILARMPAAPKTTSTTAPTAPSADGAPPEPARQIPSQRDYSSESLWQSAVRTWKLARARWRNWCEQKAAKRQARVDAEAEAFRKQLEAARRGE